VEFHAKNKFAKLVRLFGFIIKKFVTVNGHMKVKRNKIIFLVLASLMRPNVYKEGSLKVFSSVTCFYYVFLSKLTSKL